MSVLRGLTTVTFFADDVGEAARWDTELLGVGPYFVRPEAPSPAAHVELRLGDFQHAVGTADRRYAPPAATKGPGGVVAYWHVDDIEGTLAKMLELGAIEYEPVTVRGEGFVTASVLDPFGNVLGIMYNAHYLEMVGDK